tara:strand:- start:156 stop:641 length:486 start_codon:yes stop_codon:yes gene_type:complete
MNYLYLINSELALILKEIELNDGEITDGLSSKLEIAEADLMNKSESYVSVIKTKESFISAIDSEIKRLQDLKKKNTNLVSKLKDRLLEAVKIYGDFENGTHTFGTRKSSSVEVEDVNSLPAEFKTVKVVESADKKAIKDALSSGKTIKGCSIVDNLNLKIS